jgi:hypothetical protein
MSETRTRIGGTGRHRENASFQGQTAIMRQAATGSYLDDGTRLVASSRHSVKRLRSPIQPHRVPRSVVPTTTVRSAASHVKRPKPGGPRRRTRRFVLLLGLGAIALVLVVTVPRVFAQADVFPLPSEATLTGLSLSERIVAIAQSQVGYSTQPSNSYCNKYSAYWSAGQADCPSGERSEEWCADFAAWAWREAGVPFVYGYRPGDINGAAASFYQWGVATGEWHSAGSGYVPSPGDVAVYGLSFGAVPSAAHAAVVIGDTSGQSGPNVVNGDGDHTGFSMVEIGTDQLQVQVGQEVSTLDGYVSPP